MESAASLMGTKANRARGSGAESRVGKIFTTSKTDNGIGILDDNYFCDL
jgi:hypothetical protein